MGVRCLQIVLVTLLALTGHAVKGEQLPEPVRSVLNLREIPADSLSVHVADVETGEIIVDWMSTEPRNALILFNHSACLTRRLSRG